MNSAAQLAMLLAAGHLIGDFWVQSSAVAGRKSRSPILLRHGGETFLTLTIVLWPFWSLRVMAALASVTLLHLAIDAWKVRARTGAATFLIDQGLHLLSLAGCWVFLTSGVAPIRPPDGVPLTLIQRYGWGMFLAGLLAFNLRGGCALVRLALGATAPHDESAQDRRGRGETIGYLERVLVMTSVIANQWSLIGLVMAAKSIARFRELDSQDFAEYYLVGTLTSVLVAVIVGILAAWTAGLGGLSG